MRERLGQTGTALGWPFGHLVRGDLFSRPANRQMSCRTLCDDCRGLTEIAVFLHTARVASTVSTVTSGRRQCRLNYPGFVACGSGTERTPSARREMLAISTATMPVRKT